MADSAVLDRSYYSRPATELAPDMLGKLLCRRFPDGVRRYRVTETEIYYGTEDTACHAHRCPTGRARIMFEAGGLAYVHRCHMFNLLTIVTGPEGHPEGVLIRGAEGFDGPGRIGRELGLELSMYGSVMSPDGVLWMEDDGCRPDFGTFPRIGIGYASEEDRARLWRFRIRLVRGGFIECQAGVSAPDSQKLFLTTTFRKVVFNNNFHRSCS